ncbi:MULTISPECIES: polysaccharide lyase 8 family protein [unclassified Amycolatopsis]|uniref:polysaccharide lyase 8 family protein n=1 Tax=unclassified Amycolatopsis TaxID=2618356 RepID=UPI00287546EC|nr:MULTISPECIES: polysaccharide lyase 8 family protein [unclassified Amycolatopsis]MDS0135599.1 polysaccharide lyase 8 family protein [Amycolatopsis sp. 505]MDS0148385.1 polysaccharide lyase 8 family protein [Amycolatopsis sp. CM201R]
MPVNRRNALRGGALAAASTVLLTRPAFAAPAAKPAAGAQPAGAVPAATAPIVAAYRQLQTGINRPSPERTEALANLGRVAKAYNASLSVAGGGAPLWTDLPLGPGSDYTTSMYARLRAIAVDWGTPGGALSGDPVVLDRVKTALELIYASQYNENVGEIGNWYTYEIGIPYYLLHTLSVVADQLTPEQLARYLKPVKRFVGNPNLRANNASVIETGANRADKALISIVSGAMLGDTAWIKTGIDALTDVAGGGAASVVAKLDRAAGDGFHVDGSFIQHDTIPYPGHYGIVLLTALAGAIHVTQGTEYALPQPLKDKIYALVADSFAPFVYAGALMEPVRGRMLSRQGETGHDIGHQLTVATLVLARTASGKTKTDLNALAAKWLKEGTFAPFLKIPDPERFAPGPDLVATPGIEFAQDMLASGVRPARIEATHRVFGQQDRLVHITDGWSASLGVSSTRISRYEAINGQNLKGYHVGDGVLYTFLPNAKGHYTDAYWPTVDPLLLPGTTEHDGPVDPKFGGVPVGPNAHTGGVRWDARHGTSAFDFKNWDGSLVAKKSWFFTPDGIVCLGAGITSTSGYAVRTTIENRNLGEGGRGTLLADGRRLPTDLGKASALRKPRWVHLENVGGYLLLDDASVTALREDRTGAWRDIDTGANTKGTTTPNTRRYQKLVLEHGVKPTDAKYAYAVLPGASVIDTLTASWAWRVLANTPVVQAIRVTGGTVLANFFAAGSVGDVSVSGPASVAIGRCGARTQLAVSDPTQLQDSVTITVRGRAVEVPLKGTFGATKVVLV